MKRLSLALLSLLLAVMLTACSTAGTGGENTTGGTKTPEATTADPYADDDPVDYDEIDLSKYISLGQYKNIALEVPEIEYQIAIREILTQDGAYFEKVTDRPVREGDVINVDYTGKRDGLEFDGGKDTNVKLTAYENGKYIEGFAAGFFGAMPGEKSSFEVTFPENYAEATLAGKKATFEFTVNYIYEADALTDEIVKDVSLGECETVDEYEEKIRKSIFQEPLWKQIVENATVIEYPVTQVNYYYQQSKAYYTYYGQSYGMTFEAYIQAIGLSVEKLYETAQRYVKEDLVYHTIRRAEKVTLTEEEYDERLESYINLYKKQYGYAEDYIMQNLLAEIEDGMLYDKVQELLMDFAQVTWTGESDGPVEEGTGSAETESGTAA